MEDFLFPFLHDPSSQTADWWTVRSFTHLEQRIEAMNWLSKHKVGHWVTYVVMNDFLDVNVVQYLHSRNISNKDIQNRIATFFFGAKKPKISTISLKDITA